MQICLTPGIRATIYDYLELRELLPITQLSKSERKLVLTTTHRTGLIKPKPLDLALYDLISMNVKVNQLQTAISLSSDIDFRSGSIEELDEKASPDYLRDLLKAFGERPITLDAEFWFLDCIVHEWPKFNKLPAFHNINSLSLKITDEDTKKDSFSLLNFRTFFGGTDMLSSLSIDWGAQDMSLNFFLTELDWPMAAGLRKLRIYTITPEMEIDLSKLSDLSDFELTVFRNSSLQCFDSVELVMPEEKGRLRKLNEVTLGFSPMDTNFYYLDRVFSKVESQIHASRVCVVNCMLVLPRQS